MNYPCLSIAGFDSSGGAGIQADLKTFSALGCYGMSVLTALPVQNTQGVRTCYEIPLQAIEDQLVAIFDDITPKAIKIGMLFSEEIISVVADFLQPSVGKIPIILDPVMVAKSGHLLLQPDAMTALREQLLPIATLVTPNLPEAYQLLNQSIPKSELHNYEQITDALLELHCNAVLLKGGHAKSDSSRDLLKTKDGITEWLQSPRINSKNTHGTGCTLSAAITALLAQGLSLSRACEIAKIYLQQAIESSKTHSVGKGNGPVNHFYHLWPHALSFME